MKQHTTPCAECPWRRESAPGWLGASTPEEFMLQAQSEIRMPCHCHVDYEQEDWEDQIEDAPRCAGHAIFLKNSCKMPREPGLKQFVNEVNKDTTKVFNWPHEFLAHHNQFK